VILPKIPQARDDISRHERRVDVAGGGVTFDDLDLRQAGPLGAHPRRLNVPVIELHQHRRHIITSGVLWKDAKHIVTLPGAHADKPHGPGWCGGQNAP
jgi:hypothetical protein